MHSCFCSKSLADTWVLREESRVGLVVFCFDSSSQTLYYIASLVKIGFGLFTIFFVICIPGSLLSPPSLLCDGYALSDQKFFVLWGCYPVCEIMILVIATNFIMSHRTHLWRKPHLTPRCLENTCSTQHIPQSRRFPLTRCFHLRCDGYALGDPTYSEYDELLGCRQETHTECVRLSSITE